MCHIFESIFLIMLNEAWNIVTSASSLIFFIRSSCFWISNFICFSFSSGGLWACSFSTSLILFCHQHRLSSSIPPAVSAFGLCPCKWGQKSKPLGCSAPSCLSAPPAPARELPSQPVLCFYCYWWHSGGLHTPGGGLVGLHLHPTKCRSGSGPPVHLCKWIRWSYTSWLLSQTDTWPTPRFSAFPLCGGPVSGPRRWCEAQDRRRGYIDWFPCRWCSGSPWC